MKSRRSGSLARGLLDTNVLVHAWRKGTEQHERSYRLRARGIADRDLLVISPQILTEFYRAITNRRVLDPPASPDEARREVIKLRTIFDTAYPGARVSHIFEELLGRHRPTSARVFDLYLAATAIAFDLRRIYTFHIADFAGIDELEAVEPPSGL